MPTMTTRYKIGTRGRAPCSNGWGWSILARSGTFFVMIFLGWSDGSHVAPQVASQRSGRSIRRGLLCAGPIHRWRRGACSVARFPDPSIRTENTRYSNVRRHCLFCAIEALTWTEHLSSREGAASSSIPLIGLTIHGSTGVPVPTPHRAPRLEGEDTASIILTPAMINPSASDGAENRVTGE